MKVKRLVSAVAVAGLACAGAVADARADSNNEKEITRGATTGLVIGAVAGGPVGAFTGAVLGGEVFGRLFLQRRENREMIVEIAALQEALSTQHAENEQLISALNQDLDTMLALQATTPRSHSLPIQFRTASSDIEIQYEKELRQIANILKRNKDATVTLAGFADRRGDDSFNQDLSEKRVRSVKKFLLKEGVGQNQIRGLAYGETRPLENVETLESNFFDRRVVLEVDLKLDPQLATR